MGKRMSLTVLDDLVDLVAKGLLVGWVSSTVGVRMRTVCQDLVCRGGDEDLKRESRDLV